MNAASKNSLRALAAAALLTTSALVAQNPVVHESMALDWTHAHGEPYFKDDVKRKSSAFGAIDVLQRVWWLNYDSPVHTLQPGEYRATCRVKKFRDTSGQYPLELRAMSDEFDVSSTLEVSEQRLRKWVEESVTFVVTRPDTQVRFTLGNTNSRYEKQGYKFDSFRIDLVAGPRVVTVAPMRVPPKVTKAQPPRSFGVYDRSAEVQYYFQNDNIEEALRVALNSVGDTISLSLSVGASGTIRMVNFGAERATELEVERTEDGYTVSLAEDWAGSMGPDLFELGEINATAGINKKLIFKYRDLSTLADGIGQMANVTAMELAKVIPDTQDVLEAATVAAQAAVTLYDQAVQAVRDSDFARVAAWTFYTAERSAYLLELATLEAFEFFGADFTEEKRALASVLQGHLDQHDEKQRAYENAIDQQFIMQQEMNRLIQEEYRRRQELDALNHAFTSLGGEMSAVQMELRAGANVGVALGMPGVELEGFGLSAELAANVRATIRTEFATATEPRRMILGVSADLEGDISAAFGEGISGAGAAEVAFNVIFEDRGGRFVQIDFVAHAGLDVAVKTHRGYVRSEGKGVGQEYRVEMSQRQWMALMDSVQNNLGNLNSRSLQRGVARLNLRVTYSSQDKRTYDVDAKLGAEIGGWGLAGEYNLSWVDRAEPLSIEIDLLDEISKMLSSSHWRSQAQILSTIL